jgi:hypothetical protein
MEVGCSSRFSVLGDGLNTAWRLRTRLSDCGADASEAYENGEKDSQFELPLDAFNAIELSSFAWINVVRTFSAATEHPQRKDPMRVARRTLSRAREGPDCPNHNASMSGEPFPTAESLGDVPPWG